MTPSTRPAWSPSISSVQPHIAIARRPRPIGRRTIDVDHPLVLLVLTLLAAGLTALATYRLDLAGALLAVVAAITIACVILGLQGLVVPLMVAALLPLPLITIRSAGFGPATFAAPVILAAGILIARRRQVPVRILYRWWAVALVTVAAVSVLNSWLFWDPNVGVRQDRGFGHRWLGYQVTAIFFLAIPFLALMAGMVFGQLERLKALYYGVLASLTGTALLGLWGWWHNPVNPLDIYPTGQRPNINPDATAFLIVLATALLIWTRSARWRLLAIVLLAIGLVAAYLSYYLDVWLAALGAVAVLVGGRWGWRGVLAWLGGLAAVALAVLPVLNTIVTQRLLGNDSDRILLWQSALTIWSKSPVMGVGAGNLASYMESYSRFSITYVLQGYQAAHNIFLELLAEIGVVGLVVFLGFFISVLVKLLRRVDEMDRFHRQFRSAAAGMLVASAIMASVGSGLVPTIATEGWSAVAPVLLTWFFAGCALTLSLGKPGTVAA